MCHELVGDRFGNALCTFQTTVSGTCVCWTCTNVRATVAILMVSLLRNTATPHDVLQDGSGEIDLEELRTVMTSLGYSPTDKQLEDMMAKVCTPARGTGAEPALAAVCSGLSLIGCRFCACAGRMWSVCTTYIYSSSQFSASHAPAPSRGGVHLLITLHVWLVGAAGFVVRKICFAEDGCTF